VQPGLTLAASAFQVAGLAVFPYAFHVPLDRPPSSDLPRIVRTAAAHVIPAAPLEPAARVLSPRSLRLPCIPCYNQSRWCGAGLCAIVEEPMQSEVDVVKQLRDELKNFEQIAQHLIPKSGELPRLRGFDVYGGTLPLNGVVGGDHLIYMDFKQRFDLERRIAQAAENGRAEVVQNLERCQKTAGIAVLDVSGHRVTDAFVAAMLHQAFLLGAIYELDNYGQVTRRLFENLNTRFYQSSSPHKFVSMIYGEISEDARFRFLSAAQPFPTVFSNEHDRFMEVSADLCVSFPPLGMLPSFHVTDRQRTESLLGFKERYEMNEWVIMGEGDILLLHTDGLTDHRGLEDYFPQRLEQKIREVKHRTAAEIFEAVTADMLAFADPTDDVSLVVIKRN
jgi:serine phosphatase RsbU (regulator of sigma subunit)